jgi:hypothetical protein
MNPSAIGAQAELRVTSALMNAGFHVFAPCFSAHSRVDLIYLGSDGAARRVQCKTSRFEEGFISFRTCSNTNNQPLDYRGEIDEFGVFSPELRMVYLVPVDDVPLRLARLRIDPTKSNQMIGVRYAKPYELGPP